WVKFEEDVEEGGNRWSKPHVATLSLQSLFELRNLLLNNVIMLDMEAQSLDQIADLLLDDMVISGNLPEGSRDKVREALLRRHKHLHEKNRNMSSSNLSRLPIIRSLADIGKIHSSSRSTTNVPQVESHGSGIGRSPSGVSLGRNQSGTNLAGENGDVHTSK
ncbi:unnamed protein product, partial [Allacma fusca]